MDLKPGQTVRLVACDPSEPEAFRLAGVDRSDPVTVDIFLRPIGEVAKAWASTKKPQAAINTGDLTRLYPSAVGSDAQDRA